MIVRCVPITDIVSTTEVLINWSWSVEIDVMTSQTGLGFLIFLFMYNNIELFVVKAAQ